MNHNKQQELVTLAQRIRQARESVHISQKELGENIGVSDKSISSYEKGRSMPSFEKLKKIASITKKPITYFTDEQTKNTNILEKLLSIEQDLEDIKKLLQNSQEK
jgi:transcriptional regulator with XRE-family HTH domain